MMPFSQNSELTTQNLRFTDTHCHIHESDYPDPEGAYRRAMEAGVRRLICVGTDEKSSRKAVEFASSHDNVWASVGLHPHDATSGVVAVRALEDHIRASSIERRASKIVAIGEIGLDYFYDNSPRHQQIEMLHAQLELAHTYHLPVIFHVREALTDFWPIFDQYKGLRGLLHSFTDNLSNLEQGLSRGLLVGVNGISTFAKGASQLEMYRSIPVESLLFETDAPFLTPVPHRGTVNEPAFITLIAQHIANLRSISLEELSRATQRNATTLFFSNK